MPKFRIDAAILAVALAAALSLRLSAGNFEWLSSAAALSLLFVLFAFDEGYRSAAQSLAFSSVAAFCLAIAAQLPFALLATVQDPHQTQMRLTYTWAFATIILWAIDRARMPGRVEIDSRESSARPVIGRTFTAAPAVTPSFAPAAATPRAQPEPPPAYQPAPAPTATAPVPAPTQEPPPIPAPIPPGREAVVYVSLVGEGIPCLRSVQAEHLGRDFYRIAEPMPEGEVWEYQTGQVVRAKKKNLSSGKALVAFEEAPRA